MTENTAEIVLADTTTNAQGIIDAFQNPDAAVFSTIKVESFADRITVIKAMTNAKKLGDNLGKTFNLTGWTAQAVDVVQDSGELNPSVRVVLMADDGTAYDCVSTGIAKALSNLQAVLGEPSSWPEPVKVKAVEEKGRRGFRYTTLVLA